MPVTPIYGLRSPLRTDTPDVPRDMGWLADDVDKALHQVFPDAAARDAYYATLPGGAQKGMVCTVNGLRYKHNGTEWIFSYTGRVICPATSLGVGTTVLTFNSFLTTPPIPPYTAIGWEARGIVIPPSEDFNTLNFFVNGTMQPYGTPIVLYTTLDGVVYPMWNASIYTGGFLGQTFALHDRFPNGGVIGLAVETQTALNASMSPLSLELISSIP